MLRKSLVLGSVALALLAFILVFERGTLTTGEREARAGRVLDSLVRDRLTHVSVQRKGVTTALARSLDKDEAADNAWRVEQPFSAKADPDSVDTLVGELEWLMARRTIRDVKAEDLARFGLDKPRYRISYTVGRQTSSLIVGHDSPKGDGTYVQAGDPSVAYVVGKNLVEALDHPPEHFHTKELHAGISAYATQKLTLRGEGADRVISKRGDYYWLTQPDMGLASEAVVLEIASALDGLKATRFISTKPAQPADYGFTTPRFSIEIETRKASPTGKAQAKDETPSVSTLRASIGKACADHVGESYVQVDSGPVMCASDAELAKLQKSPEAIFDKRLLVLDDSQILGVRIRSGKTELRLREEDTGWKYELVESGKAQPTTAADDAAVSDWFKMLRAAELDSFVATPGPMRDVGLDTPLLTVTFERAKDTSPYEVRFGRVAAGRVPAQRLDEEALLWFPDRVLFLVSTSAARFRPLRLLDEAEGALQSLTVKRISGPEAVIETVTKAGAGWELAAPENVKPERASVDELARLLSHLEAVRFVADAPETSHGLSNPEITLTFTYAPESGKQPKSHVLKIGAETEGGRYAQLDGDPAVFVAPDVLVSLLEAPLVSRSLLGTPREAIAAIDIERAGKKLRIEATADGFMVTGTADGEPARAQRLANAIATLRATRAIAYGKSKPEEGLDAPAAKIVVHGRGESDSTTLLIGRQLPAEERAGSFARRVGLDVAFELPADAVDVLLERSAVPAGP